MKILKIIFILIIIIFSSYNRQETNLDFEKKVMNDIFLDLVDTLFVDYRLVPFPPLPPGHGT